MASTHYKDLVRRLCSAVNRGDVRDVDTYLTPDFTDIGQAGGPEEFVADLAAIRRRHPDATWDVLDLVAEGSTVVLRVRLSATTPDGFRISTDQVHIYEGRDGRIATRHRLGPALDEWLPRAPHRTPSCFPAGIPVAC